MFSALRKLGKFIRIEAERKKVKASAEEIVKIWRSIPKKHTV